MPKNQPTPLTTEQAIDRARRIIVSGQRLTRAADAVTETRNSSATTNAAAETVKEHALLDYRLATIPDTLESILEALILAATDGVTAPKGLHHAGS